MDKPDGHAVITGPCGDTDEFFLRIRFGRIEDVRFLTTGCLFTVAACDATAFLATGKSVREAMGITQERILAYRKGYLRITDTAPSWQPIHCFKPSTPTWFAVRVSERSYGPARRTAQ
jgi:NifU-like protein involved in Fe-S cluster formation